MVREEDAIANGKKKVSSANPERTKLTYNIVSAKIRMNNIVDLDLFSST